MHTYVYDATYQVTDVNYPAGYGDNFTDTEYAYDAASNFRACQQRGIVWRSDPCTHPALVRPFPSAYCRLLVPPDPG